MNVLLVSQCSKRALTETRRIIDQFAERCGQATWQTAITMDGLNTLRKLLRKTARKNTAVACHWIRGKDHSELMWIVGDASQFNHQGTVPTNTSERDILRSADENNWHTGEDIKLLAQMAALLHDLGKASVAFQQRLRNRPTEKNLYRHEWVSLRLFLGFVGKDDDATWLQRLAAPSAQDDKFWTSPTRYFRDGLDELTPKPFENLPPLASAIAWLVVTHHRLPVIPVFNTDTGEQQKLGRKSEKFGRTCLPNLLNQVTHEWNEIRRAADSAAIEPYWQFAEGLPVTLPKWRTQAAKLAKRLTVLVNSPSKGDWLNNPYVMHLARMSLMLADHHYSALPPNSPERVKGDSPVSLFANTHSDGKLKQPLDEHLLGVTKFAGSITHSLPSFERFLPRLARHRGLKKRSESARFRWQDNAFDAARAMSNLAMEQGAFMVNMASTGCGKTLANARILYALADPERGMRATFALGLRTLTLQTGRSYRDDLHLDDDELAIRVGGSANRALFEFYETQAEASGSASVQDLIEEDSHVLYEGQYADHPLLAKAMADTRIRALLSAPVLVCTIDHLTPATEAQRAGRQIAPMLRLMSTDLVLDELDDFDLADLPALTRLVYWAGLLGSRVLLSSATLPPSLVEGMYLAYREGRKHFQRNRGIHGEQSLARVDIPCLWVDEFGVKQATLNQDERFSNAHQAFVNQRVAALNKAIATEGAKRCGVLVPIDITEKQPERVHQAFAKQLHTSLIHAHDTHHEICPNTQKRVSFGLIRMANIEPLFNVAQTLFALDAPENYCIHLCVYHSRLPLLVRSAIEHQLDTTLNRRNPMAVYERADIRAQLNSSPAEHHVFVVLGSPVTEVGRDHDYDWAIVEPSSMRSLIQLAGRVQRHRQKTCSTPNIFIFDKNVKSFTTGVGPDKKPKAAFLRPGFESTRDEDDMQQPFRLISHRMKTLLNDDEYQIISSLPRITQRAEPLQPKKSLVDLEHERMMDQMLPRNTGDMNAACAWQDPQAGLTWALPQQQPFRDDSLKRETTLVFLPNADEDALVLHEVFQEAKRGQPAIYTTAESRLSRLDVTPAQGVVPWGEFELLTLLEELAEEQGIGLKQAAEKFTAVSVIDNKTQGWRYHPVLGFGNAK